MQGVGGQMGWRRAVQGRRSEEDDKIQSSDAIQALVEKVRVAKPFPCSGDDYAGEGAIQDCIGRCWRHRCPSATRWIERITMKCGPERDLPAGKGIIATSSGGRYPAYRQTNAGVARMASRPWWKKGFTSSTRKIRPRVKDLQGDGYTVLERI